MLHLITEFPQFFTATIKEWYNLLLYGRYKEIITSSLRFLVENKRIRIHAFNHYRCLEHSYHCHSADYFVN